MYFFVMKMKGLTLIVSLFINFVICRDFYVGMFKENDVLVAQDRLYKEKTPFRSTVAKYGRHFKCPITYLRIVDRLGVGSGPRVQITRGGLRHPYIVLRIQGVYNNPISVNIYVGCEHKTTTISTTTISTTASGGSSNQSDVTNATSSVNETTTAKPGGHSSGGTTTDSTVPTEGGGGEEKEEPAPDA